MSQIPPLSLIKARNCHGCFAYSSIGFREGSCSLGFKLEQLGKKATHGRYSNGDYWAFYCKPKERCLKPKTGKQYVAAMSERYGKNRQEQEF